MLIVFEGINGSGKSSIAKPIAESLGAEYMHFPNYDTPSGRLIDQYLRGQWGAVDEIIDRPLIGAAALQALQVVNRIECLDALEKAVGSRTNHLVLDRYWQSGWVYGQMDGLAGDWLTAIQRVCPPSDLNFLVLRDPERAASTRGGRIYEVLPKLKTADRLYRQLWASGLKIGRCTRWLMLPENDLDTMRNLALSWIERELHP